MFANRCVRTSSPGGQRQGLIWVSGGAVTPPDLSDWQHLFKDEPGVMPHEPGGLIANSRETIAAQHGTLVHRRYEYRLRRQALSLEQIQAVDYYIQPNWRGFGYYDGPYTVSAGSGNDSSHWQQSLWYECDWAQYIVRDGTDYDTPAERETLFTETESCLGSVSTHRGRVDVGAGTPIYISPIEYDLTELSPLPPIEWGSDSAHHYERGTYLTRGGVDSAYPSIRIGLGSIPPTTGPAFPTDYPIKPELYIPRLRSGSTLSPGYYSGTVPVWQYTSAQAAPTLVDSSITIESLSTYGVSVSTKYITPTIMRTRNAVTTTTYTYDRRSTGVYVVVARHSISYMTL